MKINKDVAISTPSVLLVPYEARHVPRYHEWMRDEEIQELTASEPLSLKEEYENQTEWREAHDKLTFILCRPPPPQNQEHQEDHRAVRAGVDDVQERMLGDINFFIYRDYGGGEEDQGQVIGDDTDRSRTTPVSVYGEVDVMVAETHDRGKGVGFGAVCALLVYLQRHLTTILAEYQRGGDKLLGEMGNVMLTRLVAKIKVANERSRLLFRRLGFEQRGETNYFGEVEMVIEFGEVSRMGWFSEAEKGYLEVRYDRDRW